MTKVIDITGQKFGHLTVESRAPNGPSGKSRWNCMCECGSKSVVTAGNLKFGLVISCGCKSSRLYKTHGMSKTRVYRIWDAMLQRCENPKTTAYRIYGGRGITVCSRWHTFENFVSDMGEPPDGHSIDRIDSNGNYEPSNCRWATAKEQARNVRRNRILEINGRRQCMAAWVEELGLDQDKLRYRLRKGMSPEEAIRYASR